MVTMAGSTIPEFNYRKKVLAQILAETLDKAISKFLDNKKSPARKSPALPTQ